MKYGWKKLCLCVVFFCWEVGWLSEVFGYEVLVDDVLVVFDVFGVCIVVVDVICVFLYVYG